MDPATGAELEALAKEVMAATPGNRPENAEIVGGNNVTVTAGGILRGCMRQPRGYVSVNF